MIIIQILDSIFHKLVVADFITFATFVAFAGIYNNIMSFAIAKTIATALASSRLDYCNSLDHHIAFKDILQLQRVQNCLARVVPRSPRFSRSIPLLKSYNTILYNKEDFYSAKILRKPSSAAHQYQSANRNPISIPNRQQ